LNIVCTADGSKTLYSDRFAEHYHNVSGAESESNYVFIDAGYMEASAIPVAVLEIGFGTGLNAWLTLQQATRMQRHTLYETLERYPVDDATAQALSDDELFRRLHSAPWEQSVEINRYFTLFKNKSDILKIKAFARSYDVVYFDAFSPRVQPEMWNRDIFELLYAAMNPGGVLTTYCAKGDVRRTLQNIGFSVERLPGAVGKREMLRARIMCHSPL